MKKIQCPECHQKFDISDELINQMVQCRSCERSFKAVDTLVVKNEKKIYPGEKKNAHLEKFNHSKPKKSSGVDSQLSNPESFVDIGPLRPRRLLAVAFGVGIMLLVIIIFLLAGGKEGAMRDMETPNRFILVGFVTLLGGGLVVYGMVKDRIRGILIAFILGGILLALPVVFPGNPMSETSEETLHSLEVAPSEKPAEIKLNTPNGMKYLLEIGYQPVMDSLEGNKTSSVIAIYIQNASPSVRDVIKDYLYEKTGKINRGVAYDHRGKDPDADTAGLLVFEKQKLSLEQMAKICSKFAKINQIHHELRVIDLSVDNELIESLKDKSSVNASDPRFYVQQLKALDSINQLEVEKTVVRLAGVPPKALRRDITQKLLQLLPEASNELKLEIVNTLTTWSQPGDGAEKIVFQAAEKLYSAKLLDKTTVKFLIDRKADGTDRLLMELWKSNPGTWSDMFISLKGGAEVLLVPFLEKMNKEQIVSVSDILGKVGSKGCIPHLQGVIGKQDDVAKKSLKAAIDEIKKRL